MANGVGQKTSWLVPAGAALTLMGAIYTQGVTRGSSDAGLKDAEQRIESLGKEISRLEGEVDQLRDRVGDLSKTQNLLEYQLRERGNE